MGTKIQVVDFSRIPGREDVLAIVEFVNGNVNIDRGDFIHTKTDEVWRVSSIATHPAPADMPQPRIRLPLGLMPMGNGHLEIGDILETQDL